MRNAHLLTVAGAAQVGLAASGATPVSRFTGGHAPGTINEVQSIAGLAAVDRAVRVMARRSRCYDSRMRDDLDQLAARISELARLVHSLRSENQQLRAQLAAVSAEHESMRGRVEEASRRLDLLMERLPAPATSVPWNT
jgi:phage shock protein A